MLITKPTLSLHILPACLACQTLQGFQAGLAVPACRELQVSQTFPGLLSLPPAPSYRWLRVLREGRELPWAPGPRALQRRLHHPRERQERQGWCRPVVRGVLGVLAGRVCPPYQADLEFQGCRASQSVPAKIIQNTARLLHSDNSPSDLARRVCQHLPASLELRGLPSHLEVL